MIAILQILFILFINKIPNNEILKWINIILLILGVISGNYLLSVAQVFFVCDKLFLK
jgi:hypothetical protein